MLEMHRQYKIPCFCCVKIWPLPIFPLVVRSQRYSCCLLLLLQNDISQWIYYSLTIQEINLKFKGVIQSKKTFDMCYQTLRASHRNQQNENRTVLCIFNELVKRYTRRPFALSLTWANGHRVYLYRSVH